MHPINQSVVLALVLGATVTSVAAGAQSEREDAHHRNECRLAAQVLSTGHPAPHYQWALETIWRCEETGAGVLADIWRRPPADSMALERLVFASYALRDARVTSAAAEAAAAPARPQLVRLNAMRVLVGHVEPSFMIGLRDLTQIDSDSVRSVYPSVDHVVGRSGPVPVDAGTVAEVLRALGRLRADSDVTVAAAAARAHQQLCARIRSADCVRE